MGAIQQRVPKQLSCIMCFKNDILGYCHISKWPKSYISGKHAIRLALNTSILNPASPTFNTFTKARALVLTLWTSSYKCRHAIYQLKESGFCVTMGFWLAMAWNSQLSKVNSSWPSDTCMRQQIKTSIVRIMDCPWHDLNKYCHFLWLTLEWRLHWNSNQYITYLIKVKINVKISSSLRWPFCLDLNVLSGPGRALMRYMLWKHIDPHWSR